MDAAAVRIMHRKLADTAIRDDMPVAGYHSPGPAIGMLLNRRSGYDFIPLTE